MRIAVIGAGLSGLAAARALALANNHVEVFESADAVGGMARTLEFDGHRLDLGPHTLYPRDTELVEFVQELLGDNLTDIRVRRGAVIGGKSHDFPFLLNDFVRHSRIRDLVRALPSYARARFLARFAPAEVSGFTSYADWCRAHMGQAVYAYFIEPYMSKSMGLPPSALPAAWAADRVHVPRWRGPGRLGKSPSANPPRSHYVRGGIGGLADALASEVLRAGGQLSLGARVTSLALGADRRFVDLESTASSGRWDAVVSTVPLGDLVAMVGPVVGDGALKAAQRLRCRATVLVFMEFPAKRLFDRGIWYLPNPAHPVNRAYEPRHYDEGCSPGRSTAVCFEIHCEVGDPLWLASDPLLVELCQAALSEIPGLDVTTTTGRLLGVHRESKHYPLPDPGALAQALEAIDSLAPLVVTAGRMGTHAYLNMDDAILSGTGAASVVLGGLGASEARDLTKRRGFVEGQVNNGGVR